MGDISQVVFGPMRQQNNLWVSHVLGLTQTPVLLWAFAEWSGQGKTGRGLRIAAVIAVAVSTVLILAVDSPDRFARVSGPLQAALLSVAAILVLVRRGLASEQPLLRADWFWASVGVLVLYSLTALYPPLLDLFTAKEISAIPGWAVMKGFAVLTIISNLLFARAIVVSAPVPSRAVPAPA
jgi:magnesium-transporting ATPase (P-type)